MSLQNLLAITALLSLSALWADDLPRKWVKPSDGFVWPSCPKDAPVFDIRTERLADLDDRFREIAAIQVKGPNEEAPKQVDLAEVDLNGDGKDEIFLRLPQLGGTGGYYFAIYTPVETGYRDIGSAQVVDVKFVEKKNGWYQIETSGRGGPSDYVRELHTFSNDRYATSRLECHDLAARKMVVGKIKAEIGDCSADDCSG